MDESTRRRVEIIRSAIKDNPEAISRLDELVSEIIRLSNMEDHNEERIAKLTEQLRRSK